jgi:hypothetical protein
MDGDDHAGGIEPALKVEELRMQHAFTPLVD